MPIVAVPKQNKYMTPNDFIRNDFGAANELREDRLREDARISRYMNNLMKAVVESNRIITGFKTTASLEGSDIRIFVAPGTAVVDKTYLETVMPTEHVLTGIVDSIPSRRGKILLFMYFKYSDMNDPIRPLVKHQIGDTIVVPGDMTNFNPFRLQFLIKDDETDKIVNVEDLDPEFVDALKNSREYTLLFSIYQYDFDKYDDLEEYVDTNMFDIDVEGDIYTIFPELTRYRIFPSLDGGEL